MQGSKVTFVIFRFQNSTMCLSGDRYGVMKLTILLLLGVASVLAVLLVLVFVGVGLRGTARLVGHALEREQKGLARTVEVLGGVQGA